ncbi:hypothetical protein RFI_01301 [Reticulomyxa filosa]|uniref:Uncharacterized protein n=1 Tax=Reticulomyxa filosa TaxID=46433 RepID=X6PDL8_RETFI|nr:hypothetical protein RFI_01301 [Reticulomyxa filosa]|eukprot:ETO35762.1 hypothetical protein RFI_01301 [Reticulomyxa filosa]
MERNDESEIVRELSIYVLWKILNYPKKTKYRQINKQALYDNLLRRCCQRNVDIDKVMANMERRLEQCGFGIRAEDRNWYYQKDMHICIHFVATLFFYPNGNTYKNNNKRIYYYYYFENRHGMEGVLKTVSMLGNRKWSEYSTVFDYEHRRIVLFENEKLKVTTLQVGNRKNLSLELNVDIKYYNDFSDVNTSQGKWACLYSQ